RVPTRCCGSNRYAARSTPGRRSGWAPSAGRTCRPKSCGPSTGPDSTSCRGARPRGPRPRPPGWRSDNPEAGSPPAAYRSSSWRTRRAAGGWPAADPEVSRLPQASPPRVLLDVGIEIPLRLGDRQQLRFAGDEKLELGVVRLERGRDQIVAREIGPPLSLEAELEHSLAQDSVSHRVLAQPGRERRQRDTGSHLIDQRIRLGRAPQLVQGLGL